MSTTQVCNWCSNANFSTKTHCNMRKCAMARGTAPPPGHAVANHDHYQQPQPQLQQQPVQPGASEYQSCACFV